MKGFRLDFRFFNFFSIFLFSPVMDVSDKTKIA